MRDENNGKEDQEKKYWNLKDFKHELFDLFNRKDDEVAKERIDKAKCAACGCFAYKATECPSPTCS